MGFGLVEVANGFFGLERWGRRTAGGDTVRVKTCSSNLGPKILSVSDFRSVAMDGRCGHHLATGYSARRGHRELSAWQRSVTACGRRYCSVVRLHHTPGGVSQAASRARSGIRCWILDSIHGVSQATIVRIVARRICWILFPRFPRSGRVGGVKGPPR